MMKKKSKFSFMAPVVVALSAVLLVLPGCGSQTGGTPTAGQSAASSVLTASTTQTSKLTPTELIQSTTRSELADKLGCSLADLDDILLYAKNLNQVLPETTQTTPATTYKRGVTEDGLPWATREELRTMITATVITKENWQNYFAPKTSKIKCYSYDENDQETFTWEDHHDIDALPGYYFDWTKYSLQLVNNTTGEEFEFTNGWEDEITYENGKYYCITFDDSGKEIKAEFNVNQYTCTKADMILYQYHLDENLLCCDRQSGDEIIPVKYVDAKNEFTIDDTYVCMNIGTEKEPIYWQIGLNALGDCVLGR